MPCHAVASDKPQLTAAASAAARAVAQALIEVQHLHQGFEEVTKALVDSAADREHAHSTRWAQATTEAQGRLSSHAASAAQQVETVRIAWSEVQTAKHPDEAMESMYRAIELSRRELHPLRVTVAQAAALGSEHASGESALLRICSEETGQLISAMNQQHKSLESAHRAALDTAKAAFLQVWWAVCD